MLYGAINMTRFMGKDTCSQCGRKMAPVFSNLCMICYPSSIYEDEFTHCKRKQKVMDFITCDACENRFYCWTR